jgi:carbonic anhydrase/acetyltransferase-like protein (isoleucine patch superfamily)
MIYTIGNRRLQTGRTFYLAPSADVIGSVRLGERASVWFGAVLRGDDEWIEIGEDSNVQDLSMIHADAGFPTRIGARVTIGHKVLLHSCEVGDDSLIGNGAIVLDRVRIGCHSVIAAGTLIPPDKVIPDGVMVMGSPGKIVRELSEQERAMIAHGWQHYVAAAERYRVGLKVVE